MQICTAHECGKPAITSWTSSMTGATYWECADHAPVHFGGSGDERPTAASLGLRTRSTRPFVLVRDGRIVGFAESDGEAVQRRARREGAVIVRTR